MPDPVINEMPSTACENCPFLASTCVVPGGACPKRAIAGLPSILIGDLLVALGAITLKDWCTLHTSHTAET